MNVQTIIEAIGRKTTTTTLHTTSFDNMVSASLAEGYTHSYNRKTRVGRIWQGKKTTWKGIEIIVTHTESEGLNEHLDIGS